MMFFHRRIFSQRGVSLLELLIYVALFATIAVFLVQIFTSVIRSRATANARFEVAENMRTGVAKIQQTVLDSSLVLTGGSCPLNTFEARIGSATTTLQISSGILQIREGEANPFRNLTSSSTVVVEGIDASTCIFTKVSNPAPAKSTLQVKLKVRYNDQGRPELKYSDTAQFTISLR